MQCLLHLRENQLMQGYMLGRQGHLRPYREDINCAAVLAYSNTGTKGTVHIQYTVLLGHKQSSCSVTMHTIQSAQP